ncbi:MAG: thioredoxin [Bacteroidota bacterium]
MISTSDFEVKDFNKDVIEESHNIPVLVDYWAEWCQPCKFLGPIVEKLASEANGKWKLIKVNTEENPSIAAEWGIRGIPNLKLFYKGEVLDEVAGAMPEKDMRKWLENKLPSKAKTLTMEAASLLEIGNIEEGVSKLEEALSEDESLEQARLLLARQKIWTSPEEAATLLEGITYLESAKEILLMSEALSMKEKDLEEGVSKAEILEALKALKDNDFAKSIDLFIKSIMINKSYHNEFARKLVIALFHYLGERNDVTKTYRRRFDMALY